MEINFQSQYFINHKYAKVNNAQMNYVYAVECLSLTHATSDFGHNYSERVNIDQLGDKKLAHWLCVLCYYVQWEEALVSICSTDVGGGLKKEACRGPCRP